MATSGRNHDGTVPIGDPGPATGWDEDESTEVVSHADVGGFFGGRFRIDARLGAGAMGRVLTALDTENGQLVALKVLHRERSRDKNVLRRFAREAAALRAINHRAIVGIVASGRAPDGTPWLAMEHLTGQTLKGRIVKGGPMQPAQLWPILKTLCEAVAEAHARGVVHRDLKPDNIFLPEGGDPPCKILDFGLSTLNREGAEKVTATGQLLGTPRYMAPELLASTSKPDHRVDVFALAVVAFEALTGKSLYSAEDLGSLFGQILEARIQSLAQFRPDLPPALETVLRRGYARHVAERFASATELATAFAQAAGIDETVRAPAAPALQNLFDDVTDLEGNAPLVDPFGPAAKAGPAGAVSSIGGPLPPMAHEVAPIVPALATPASAVPRRRVATAQGGHVPDGAPSKAPPPAAPVAMAEHDAKTLYQPGPPASMPAGSGPRAGPTSSKATVVHAAPPQPGAAAAPGPSPLPAPRRPGPGSSKPTVLHPTPPQANAPSPGGRPLPAAPLPAQAIAAPSSVPAGAFSPPIASVRPAAAQAPGPSAPPMPSAPAPGPAFGAPAPTPFGAPAPTPFGAPAPTPFGAPAPTPFGAPAPTPFGAPAPTPFGAPAPTPFGAPALPGGPAAPMPGAPMAAASVAAPPSVGMPAPTVAPSAGMLAGAPFVGLASTPSLGPPAGPAAGGFAAPPSFSPPGPGGFAGPPSAFAAPAAPPAAAPPNFTAPGAPAAGPLLGPAPAASPSNILGYVLFAVAAVVVVVGAIVGAVALRWWLAQSGM